MALKYFPEKFLHVDIEELSTPKNNHKLLLNQYWVVDDEGKALLYKRGKDLFPQCNSSKMVADKLCYDGCSVRFIEQAFVSDRVC